MKIGQKIKSHRENLNISQEELAKRLNVTRSAISNWEIDRNYPDVQTLVKLSKALDLSLDDLMTDSDVENKRKRRIKPVKLSLILSILLLVLGSIFVYQKHYAVPNIHYEKAIPAEDGPKTSDTSVLFREDIQSISFDRKDNLVIKFTLSKGEKCVGHMLDGEILNVYKEKCDLNESEHDYVHRIEVDTYGHRFLDNKLIVEFAENYLGDKTKIKTGANN